MNPPLLQTYHRVSWCPPPPTSAGACCWVRVAKDGPMSGPMGVSENIINSKVAKMQEDIGQLPGSWTHLDWCQASKWWNERDVRDAFLAEGYSFWIRSYCCGDCSPKQMRYVHVNWEKKLVLGSGTGLYFSHVRDYTSAICITQVRNQHNSKTMGFVGPLALGGFKPFHHTQLNRYQSYLFSHPKWKLMQAF